MRASTLFVGNNRLQLQQVGLPQRRAIAHGRALGVMRKPMGTLSLPRLALRGCNGRDGRRGEAFAPPQKNSLHFARSLR